MGTYYKLFKGVNQVAVRHYKISASLSEARLRKVKKLKAAFGLGERAEECWGALGELLPPRSKGTRGSRS